MRAAEKIAARLNFAITKLIGNEAKMANAVTIMLRNPLTRYA